MSVEVRRDFGKSIVDDSGRLRIRSEAGHQAIERGFWLAELPEFREAFDNLSGLVRDIGEPADIHLWVERYDKSPDQVAQADSWHWDYRIPPPKA